MAFEAFFSGMPDSHAADMAFVLVQHLAPDHVSILPDLLQRCTRMPVFAVEDGMPVQANCVYVSPPGRDMALGPRGLAFVGAGGAAGATPADRFLLPFAWRWICGSGPLASCSQAPAATARRASDPSRAKGAWSWPSSSSRPSSTACRAAPSPPGWLTFSCAPEEMPAQLLAYATHAFGKLAEPALAASPKSTGALQKVFVILRSRDRPRLFAVQAEHGRSAGSNAAWPFTRSRRSSDYVALSAGGRPTRPRPLFRDLLIGVTSFFRDAGVFEVLQEQVMPALFEGKPAGDPIRVWVAGLLDRRGGLLAGHPPARAHGAAAARTAVRADLRHRHRRPGASPRRAPALPGRHRRRRLAGAAGALLPSRRGRQATASTRACATCWSSPRKTSSRIRPSPSST